MCAALRVSLPVEQYIGLSGFEKVNRLQARVSVKAAVGFRSADAASHSAPLAEGNSNRRSCQAPCQQFWSCEPEDSCLPAELVNPCSSQDCLPAVMAASTPEVLAPITLNLSPALGGYPTTTAPQQRVMAGPPAAKRFKAPSPADEFLRFLTSPTGVLPDPSRRVATSGDATCTLSKYHFSSYYAGPYAG